ncbi:hypothetical protein RISK_002936 [Rhodopirellula islandica]|uniref:Uncharacterized protein n=1 Tax=Rhodopirellula islandica TaxID=595434 RepID=A0A0J1EI01_RHOIS|nr:hypothetical protein RISK_002936 [Rhodopirellula islandica]
MQHWLECKNLKALALLLKANDAPNISATTAVPFTKFRFMCFSRVKFGGFGAIRVRTLELRWHPVTLINCVYTPSVIRP